MLSLLLTLLLGPVTLYICKMFFSKKLDVQGLVSALLFQATLRSLSLLSTAASLADLKVLGWQ